MARLKGVEFLIDEILEGLWTGARRKVVRALLLAYFHNLGMGRFGVAQYCGGVKDAAYHIFKLWYPPVRRGEQPSGWSEMEKLFDQVQELYKNVRRKKEDEDEVRGAGGE